MSISIDEMLRRAKDVAVAAGKVAGDVASEVVDTSKAKLAEARLNSEIREITERLGRIVYEASRSGRESIKLQEMLISELDGLYANLEEQNRKNAAAARSNPAAAAKNNAAVATVCPACGERNVSSAVFCNKCGTKLIGEEPVEPVEYAVSEEIEDIEDIEDTVEHVVEGVSGAVSGAVDDFVGMAQEAVHKLEEAAEKLSKE